MKILHLYYINTKEISAVNNSIEYRSRFLRENFGEKNYYSKKLACDFSHFLLNSIIGRQYYRLRDEDIEEIINSINQNDIDLVLVEGAYYGELIQKIKMMTTAKVVILMPDIESKRVLDLAKLAYNQNDYKLFIWRLLSLKNAVNSERLSVRFADCFIVLTCGDMDLFKKKYKKENVYVIPTILEDSFENYSSRKIKKKDKKKLLFVGVGTYLPNREALAWFISTVLPKVNAELTIVGRGTESLKTTYKSDKLVIVGEVENLGKYYRECDVVINPVSNGGGIQTKSIEALMHGKTIIGTPFSFNGLNITNICDIGIVCSNNKDFVDAINNYCGCTYNEKSRQEYLNNFSLKASEKKYYDIFTNCIKGENNG